MPPWLPNTLVSALRNLGDDGLATWSDQNADHSRDQHRTESNGDRHPAAIEQPREDVLPQVVCAERMRPGWARELRS